MWNFLSNPTNLIVYPIHSIDSIQSMYSIHSVDILNETTQDRTNGVNSHEKFREQKMLESQLEDALQGDQKRL